MIRTNHYLSLLSDSFLTMDLALEALKQNRETVVKILSAGTDKMLNIMVPNAPEQAKNRIRGEWEKVNREKADHYFETILNQNVVLLCSALVIILDELLEVTFTSKPETLLGFAEDKTVDLKLVVEASDYSKLLEKIRQRVIDNFSRESIGRKFGLLGKKLGIRQEELFDWSKFTVEAQAELADQNLDSLTAIFDKRHDIVHHGQRPFKKRNEVEAVITFFQNLVLNLCATFSSKFQIPDDFWVRLANAHPNP